MKIHHFTSAMFAMVFATTVAAQSTSTTVTIDLGASESTSLKFSAGLPYGVNSVRALTVNVPLAKATAVGCTNGNLTTFLDVIAASAPSVNDFTASAVMAPSILTVLAAAKTNAEPVRLYVDNNSGACGVIAADII